MINADINPNPNPSITEIIEEELIMMMFLIEGYRLIRKNDVKYEDDSVVSNSIDINSECLIILIFIIIIKTIIIINNINININTIYE